jgi:hypothetical protein
MFRLKKKKLMSMNTLNIFCDQDLSSESAVEEDSCFLGYDAMYHIPKT